MRGYRRRIIRRRGSRIQVPAIQGAGADHGIDVDDAPEMVQRGAVKVIASIEDPAVIKQILAHLEQRAAPATPAFRPFARAPPPTELPDLRELG